MLDLHSLFLVFFLDFKSFVKICLVLRCLLSHICLVGELVDLESDLSAEVAPEVIHPLILIKKVDRRDAGLVLHLVLI
jgi:hypothetical protein